MYLTPEGALRASRDHQVAEVHLLLNTMETPDETPCHTSLPHGVRPDSLQGHLSNTTCLTHGVFRSDE